MPSKTYKVVAGGTGLPYLQSETVVVDGVEVKVGDSVELTDDQVKRLQAAGVELASANEK